MAEIDARLREEVHLLGELLGSSVASDCFSSLIKKVFFDIGLALDSYGAAQRKALQDSEADELAARYGGAADFFRNVDAGSR